MQQSHFPMCFLLLVLLLTNEAVHARGPTTCGDTLTNTGSGRITSPLYPNLYPNDVTCEWTIISTFGQGIRIDIEDLDNKEILPSSNTVRCYDKLYIYEQLPSGKRQRIAKLCASSTAELQSTVINVDAQPSGSTTVVIYFKSDYVIQLNGFSLRYTIPCDTTLGEAEGTFTSPNYPLYYPDNTQCMTIIKTLPGTKIHLAINDFQFVESDGCSQDFISIKSSVNGTFLGPHKRYCNDDIPLIFTSPSNQLVIVFRSGSSNRGHGISATWSAVDPETTPPQPTSRNLLNKLSDPAKLSDTYSGTCSRTVNGYACQRWDSEIPHVPDFIPDDPNHNYCRSPDSDPKPWCYTTNPRQRWEHCDIKDCVPEEMPNGPRATTSTTNPDTRMVHSATSVLNIQSSSMKSPIGYFGTCSKTRSGIPCQRWDRSTPHRLLFFPANRTHNHCRNLDNDIIPWCYTIHPRRRWEHCNIADCVPDETTEKVEEETTSLSSTATESNNHSISSVADSQPLPIGNSTSEASVGVNGIYVVVGVLTIVILFATIVIIFVIRKHHHKRATRVPQNNDVVFQNLTIEDERENDGTLMRTRDNTYVEIPFVPYDELRFPRNGCNGLVQTDRNVSIGSDDSIAASKRDATLQRDQESSRGIPNRETKNEDQPYVMADDNEHVFDDPAPAEVKQFNPYQFIEDDDDVEHSSEPEKAIPAEENWYASPRSPLSSASNATSLYDNPRPQHPSISSKSSSGWRGQRNQSTESNYCPMNNSFIKKSQSPSKLNRNASSASNAVPESIMESTVYVPMGPQ